MKLKKISSSNLPATINVTHLIGLWFLWDKFPSEIIRTIIVIWGFFSVLIPFVLNIFATDFVDIFKDK